MDFTNTIIVIGAASSWMMAGVIWVVHLLHYPAFLFVEESQFSAFHQFHTKKISFIVVPVMLAELFSAIYWVFFTQLPLVLTVSSLVLVVAIWVATFSLQVPLHNKLSEGYDTANIHKLVSTNSIRTGLWSLKAILALFVVLY